MINPINDWCLVNECKQWQIMDIVYLLPAISANIILQICKTQTSGMFSI